MIKKGFTLIEIMIVVVILGVLAIAASNIDFTKKVDSENQDRLLQKVISIMHSTTMNVSSGKGIRVNTEMINPTSTHVQFSINSVGVYYYSGAVIIGTGEVINRPFFGNNGYILENIYMKDKTGGGVTPVSGMVEAIFEPDNSVSFSGSIGNTGAILGMTIGYGSSRKIFEFDRRYSKVCGGKGCIDNISGGGTCTSFGGGGACTNWTVAGVAGATAVGGSPSCPSEYDIVMTSPGSFQCIRTIAGITPSLSTALVPSATVFIPQAGSCNNSTKFSCTTGTVTQTSAGTCGGNSTWKCDGLNEGPISTQCSKPNPACLTSCKTLKQSGVNEDGKQTIDPDLAGSRSPIEVYCDMTTDGGGWTLIMNSAAIPGSCTTGIFGVRGECGSLQNNSIPYSIPVNKLGTGTEVLTYRMKTDGSKKPDGYIFKQNIKHDPFSDKLDLVDDQIEFLSTDGCSNKTMGLKLPQLWHIGVSTMVESFINTSGGYRGWDWGFGTCNVSTCNAGLFGTGFTSAGYGRGTNNACYVYNMSGPGGTYTTGNAVLMPEGSQGAVFIREGVTTTAPTLASCQAIKTAKPASANGIYTIDPDGVSSTASINVYCDMTTDGGGWTVIASDGTGTITANLSTLGSLPTPTRPGMVSYFIDNKLSDTSKEMRVVSTADASKHTTFLVDQSWLANAILKNSEYGYMYSDTKGFEGGALGSHKCNFSLITYSWTGGCGVPIIFPADGSVGGNIQGNSAGGYGAGVYSWQFQGNGNKFRLGWTPPTTGYTNYYTDRLPSYLMVRDKASPILASCSAIKDANSSSADGDYTIDPDGTAGTTLPFNVYCDMTTDGGGWTLVMKADGAKNTFNYDSANWTNNATLNESSYNHDATEFKSKGFSTMPFQSIRLVMSTAGNKTSVGLSIGASSLSTLFSGPSQNTTLGKSAWLSLVPGSSLQPNCNKEGINAMPNGGTRARIGITTNNENQCESNDSGLGIGLSSSNSVGNFCNYGGSSAPCGNDTGLNPYIRNSFGYIYIRDKPASAPISCNAIKENNPLAIDGTYQIDPDGSGPNLPFQAYCDMTTDGGGWTLGMKFKSTESTFGYDSPYWTDDNTLNENDTTLNENDAKFAAFSQLSGTQLKFCIYNAGLKCSNITYAGTLKDFTALDTSTQIGYAESLAIGTGARSENWIKNFGFTPSGLPDCEGHDVNNSYAKIGVVRNDGFEGNSCNSQDNAWGFGIKNIHPTPHSAGAGYVASGGASAPKKGYIFIRDKALPIYKSCKVIKELDSIAADGYYGIDPDVSGSAAPLEVYCDMTTDGGGYTYYAVDSGRSTNKYTDFDSCKELGMNMVIPRSQSHWLSMVAKYDSSYFSIIPGIYRAGSTSSYTSCAMRDPAGFGTGCPDWRAIDGKQWWIRDTPFSEPNGDYGSGTWLGGYTVNTTTINAGQGFNDLTPGHSTTKYICSTNDKIPVIGTSCAANPAIPNATGLVVGSPTSHNQPWEYSTTGGACTYNCNPGYTGENCATISTSCSSLKTAFPGYGDGMYAIDPDGGGPNSPIQAYCDMTTDGGGWTRVYDLNIPGTTGVDWNTYANVPYTESLSGRIIPYTQVAYRLQLDSDYVFASMNDFSSGSISKLGVPVDWIYQQNISGLSIISSNTSLNTTNSPGGKIEFWSNCYNPIGGNNSLYDYADTTYGPDCYGSMQIHKGTGTVFAFNSWSNSNPTSTDVGIGTRPTSHTDWTYAYNANTFTTRKMGVFVRDKPLTQPLASCSAIKTAVPGALDGTYMVDPDGAGGNTPFQVTCDMTTDGGGWTVFQRRVNGTADFYRNWADYQAGFGNIEEFWLGNDHLAAMTVQPKTLRIDMKNTAGIPYYARYNSFQIGDASTKYKLNVGGYTGDGGDSLSGHNGYMFTTNDQDNDTWGNNCAQQFSGAWWYSTCHSSNLNGLWLNGQHNATYANGVDWVTFPGLTDGASGGYYYSLPFVEMKFRDRTFLSCKEIKIANASSPDGTYTIDPDGAGGAVPFSVYCDMTTDGGGWTLTAWNKGTSNTVLPNFFVGEHNKANIANKNTANTAASLNPESFSNLVNTTSAMLKSSAYQTAPIIENNFGKWDYNTTKCTGSLMHTSRTTGCPQQANDNWNSADRFNIAMANNGIVPAWLATPYNQELCYSGRGWCDFEFYLREGTMTNYTSCQDIKTANPNSTDGTYSIDPDGAGGNAPFDVDCDMTTDGGGWTLVYYSNSDNVGRSAISGSDWNTGPSVNFSRLWSLRNTKNSAGKYEFFVKDSSTVGRNVIFTQTNAYNQNPVGNSFTQTSGNLYYSTWTNGTTWKGLGLGNYGNGGYQASCSLAMASEGNTWWYCLQDQLTGQYGTGPWFYDPASGGIDTGSEQWVKVYQRGVTASSYGTSCSAIKTSSPTSNDGTYTIDPDGVGGNAPYDVYCDMTTEGGGWTLVANWSTNGAYTTFPGRSDLSNNYTYGTYSPIWNKSSNYYMNFSNLVSKDVLFVSGNKNYYCGFDYANLMSLKNTNNPNPNIEIKYSKATLKTVGEQTNVLWRDVQPEDPWIGCAGDHTANSYTNPMTFWGEDNWSVSDPWTRKHTVLANDNNGIGVFIRDEVTPTSCLVLKRRNQNTPSGTYTIDPDGLGGNPSIQVYCDMTTDGGGWTKLMHANFGNTNQFFSNSNWDSVNSGSPTNNGLYSILDKRNLFTTGGKYTLRFQIGRSGDSNSYATTTSEKTIWKQAHDPFTTSTNGSDYQHISGPNSSTCGGFNGFHSKYQGNSRASDVDETESINCWWMQLVPTVLYLTSPGYLDGYGGIQHFHNWQTLWIKEDMPFYPSCKAIKTAVSNSNDGTYTIDPDGEGGNAPFDVYCDMTTDGGGWTRVGTNIAHTMKTTTPVSLLSVPGTETLIRYVSGNASYGGTAWPWNGVMPQRICTREGTTWSYLNYNGTPPSGGIGSDSGVPYYGASALLPPFLTSMTVGSSTGKTCVGASSNLSGACFDYVKVGKGSSNINAIADCETIIGGPDYYSDNSGTINYDFYTRDGVLPAPLTSCKAIKSANPSSSNGTYLIDPDGNGGNAAFEVYCDMTTDGGGWTLAVRIKANGTDDHGKPGSVGILQNPTQNNLAKLSDSTINQIKNEGIFRFTCRDKTGYYKFTDGIWNSRHGTAYGSNQILGSSSYNGSYIETGHNSWSSYGLSNYMYSGGMNPFGWHQNYFPTSYPGEGAPNFGCYETTGWWGGDGVVWVK